MSKIGIFLSWSYICCNSGFSSKIRRFLKKQGGWTVCEINVNKLKKALKYGWKFIYKIADILTVYFHFKYHSYMYYTHFHLYFLILDF